MTDNACWQLLQWALPRLGLRARGFHGLHRQVCKRIRRRFLALGLDGFDAYRARLEQESGEWAVLDSFCRITISRFYRDKGVFQRLEQEVLPALVPLAQTGVLRAWCAGCASGEEVWTLRLLWDLKLQASFPAVALEILGTDLDTELLSRAEDAQYPPGTLRDLPPEWRSEGFGEAEAEQRLRNRWRHQVEFRRSDLRHETPPGLFQLILCRNVGFTYFDEEAQHQLLARLQRVLAPGGAMVIGRHEQLPDSATLVPWGNGRDIYRLPEREGR